MNDDLISRQAVIDIIHRFFTEEVDKIPTKKTEDGEVLVIHKCQPLFEMNKAICKRIKALQAGNPQEPSITWVTGSDGAKIAFKDVPVWKVIKICQILDDVVEAEKEQEPKMGHWIENAPQYDMLNPQYICSECGNAHTRTTPYCEMCGAKMFESQESEDKE